MENNCIVIGKGELLSNNYVENEKQKAIALLKFRYPEYEIEIAEEDKKLIIKAVPKKREQKEEKGEER